MPHTDFAGRKVGGLVYRDIYQTDDGRTLDYYSISLRVDEKLAEMRLNFWGGGSAKGASAVVIFNEAGINVMGARALSQHFNIPVFLDDREGLTHRIRQ